MRKKRDSQMDMCSAARIGYSFETHISVSRSFAIRVIWLVVDLYSVAVCKEKLSRHWINWIKKNTIQLSTDFICYAIRNINPRGIDISVALCRSISTILISKRRHKILKTLWSLSDIWYVLDISCKLSYSRQITLLSDAYIHIFSY